MLTIIKYYNGNISKEYLREITHTTRYGTNAYFLMEAAKRIGFDSKAVTGEVSKLSKNILPCIAHVVIDNSYQHFIVIYEVNHKKQLITVADPATGIKKLTFKEYNNITTNQYILFIPNKPIPNLKKDKTILNYIIVFLNRYKVLFLSIFLFSIIYTVSNIILSYHFQFIIEGAINLGSKNNLYFISMFILIIALIKVQMDFFRNKLINIINHKLDYTLVKSIFNHIISLPYIYYKNRTTGEITSRITDIAEVKEAISQIIVTLFVDVILVLFVFVHLCTINMHLTTILIIITILYLILIIIFNPMLNEKVVDSYHQSSKINSFMIESISAVDTIKNNMLEEKIKDDFDIKYSKLLHTTYKLNNIYYIQDFLKELIYFIGIVLILFIGSKLVIENKLSLAQLITYNSLTVYYLEPIKNIFNIDITIKKVRQSINRASELLEIKRENLSLDHKYSNYLIKGDIKVNNLSYSYNGQKKLLNNISIDIKRGNKVLIYGKSGEGKSTLAKILMGYLKVKNDSIYIDNKDINDYNILQLRNNICYVSQNEFLFSDSIYNNITMNKNVDYNLFLDICKMTMVDQIVKKNLLLYDTLLEENGFNVSGGERQRILLARAMLKDSSIYILDESLSQVDIKKERVILKNIFNKLKDKTVIVISHRFNNQDLFDLKIDITERKAYDRHR